MARSIWEHLLFTRDTIQTLDIHDAQEDLSRVEAEAAGSAEEARQRYDQLAERHQKLKQAHVRLRQRVDRIELVAEALFVHLERTGQLEGGAFAELMQELDAADGKVDGRAKTRST